MFKKLLLTMMGLLAAVGPALAQNSQFPRTLPSNTVVGRLGTGAGPAQAIPFSVLGPTLITSNLLATAPVALSGLNISIAGAAGKVSAGTTGAFTSTPSLGVASSLSGSLTFANSANSGTVTLQAPSTATTYTITFPTTACLSGQGWVSNGSGIMSCAATSGTVNSGTANQLAYYASSSAAVTGNANLNVSGGLLTIGQAGSVLGGLALTGSTSGTTTLVPGVAASGVLGLPSATDTLIGKATTDTLTNKTYDTAGAGNVLKINGTAVSDKTGTGKVVLDTTPTLVTPILGVASATSINKLAITAPATSATLTVADGKTLTANASTTLAGTDGKTLTVNNSGTLGGGDAFILSIAAAKTLTVSNSLAFTGTDSTSFAFPTGSDTVVGLTATQTLTNKTLTSPAINTPTLVGGTATALSGLGIRSTGTGAFDLTLAVTENLTAGRTLTLAVNNANRTISLNGNVTVSSAFTTSGSGAITLTSNSGGSSITLPASGTLATQDTSNTFSATNTFSALNTFTDIKMSSGKIYPSADGTTAMQITKADGVTRIVNYDTTNARVGINKNAGAFDLDVNGAVNVGSTLSFLTLDATSLSTSTSTITGLTANNSPTGSNDYALYYSAADARIRKITLSALTSSSVAGVSSLNGLTGGLSIAQGSGIAVSAGGSSVTVSSSPVSPQGRCTLTSATPITTSDVTGATTVYYTPATGNQIAVYDGANWVPTTFAQMSQLTTDATKSPAAVAASKVYDIFVWNDSGTLRATRGPAWSSDTSRGTGAGTSEIDFTTAFPTNKVAITNGPGANRGTLVCSIRSNASSQINDSMAFRWLSNVYNAVPRPMQVVESTDSWAYSTAAFRQANGNAANQLDFVQALTGGQITASVQATFSSTIAGDYAILGIDIDSLNTTSVTSNINNLVYIPAASYLTGPLAQYSGYPGLGRHTAIWKEYSAGVGTGTYYGDAGVPRLQSGIFGTVFN